MSSVVIWSPHAIACVQRVYRFLALKDIEAAKNAAETLFHSAGLLEIFPNAGHPSGDLDAEQRELSVPFGSSGYILLYHTDAAGLVTVLAVRHQKEVGY